MKPVILLMLFCLPLFCLADQKYLSPSGVAVSNDGKHLFLACETAGVIQVFDVENETPTVRYAVPEVRELVLSGDGSRLYAVAGGASGRIVELDADSGEVLRSFPAGHTPVAPIVSPDGRTLYYCNRFSRTEQPDVHALDLATGKILASGKAIREPVTMQLSRDGKYLWVVNHLPLMAADDARIFASLHVFDSATLTEVKKLDLPGGSVSIRDSAMSRDGRYLFVTHMVGRFNVPTTHVDRGWMNTSGLSIFDMSKKEYVNTVLLDDVMRGAPNPWAVTVTGDDAWLCVTLAGTHEVMFVNVEDMFARIARAAAPSEIINNLAFLHGAKTRVKLEGQGARAIATHGSYVYVPMYYSDAVNVIEMWEDGPGGAVAHALQDPVAPDLIRRGDMAFNDAGLCFQNWQSCASCHPDARADSANWDLLNDGVGNPKNTRSLVFSHETPPVMITGIRPKAEVAVRAGFRFIQFTEVPDETVASVDAYLRSVAPVSSPWLVDGKLSPAALSGRRVFAKAQCITCHHGPFYTDGKLYDVGIGPDELGIEKFVTPPLREVWRTAPYLFDGRAVTMRDVLTTYNPEDRHGITSNLSEQEIADLIEYILSL